MFCSGPRTFSHSAIIQGARITRRVTVDPLGAVLFWRTLARNELLAEIPLPEDVRRTPSVTQPGSGRENHQAAFGESATACP